MKTITKVLIAGITAALLTACGSSSSSNTTPTAQDQAIDKISNYAQNGGAAPTLQDYLDAGVTGITNLDEVNAYVSGLTKEDVDTKEEIQAIANKLGVSLSPIANIVVTRTWDTTDPARHFAEGQFIRFSAEQSTDPDGNIVSYEWTEGSKTLAGIAVFDISKLSIGKHTITLTVTDNHGNTGSADVVVTIVARPAPVAPAATPQTCLQAAGYGTVELSNGQIWLDRNLGASAVGGTGSFYQFGRLADGHENPISNTTPVQATSLNPNHADFITGSDWTTVDAAGNQRQEDWSTANDPRQICPCGFIVPSPNDLYAMGAVDHSALALPNGGYRLTDGTFTNTESGFYWLAGDTFVHAFGTTDGTYWGDGGWPATHGAGIRCINPSSSVSAP